MIDRVGNSVLDVGSQLSNDFGNQVFIWSLWRLSWSWSWSCWFWSCCGNDWWTILGKEVWNIFSCFLESVFVSKVANSYQSTERVNIAVFSCYLWAISFLRLFNVGLFFIISNLVCVGICWVILWNYLWKCIKVVCKNIFIEYNIS